MVGFLKHCRVESCRSCGDDIVWFRTASGKSMPVNAETVDLGDDSDHLELPRHVSHFSTCKHASNWRKK